MIELAWFAYLDEGVVEQEHDSREIPDPCPTVIEHLADITNVTNFWVTEAEFPMSSSAAIAPVTREKR